MFNSKRFNRRRFNGYPPSIGNEFIESLVVIINAQVSHTEEVAGGGRKHRPRRVPQLEYQTFSLKYDITGTKTQREVNYLLLKGQRVNNFIFVEVLVGKKSKRYNRISNLNGRKSDGVLESSFKFSGAKTSFRPVEANLIGKKFISRLDNLNLNGIKIENKQSKINFTGNKTFLDDKSYLFAGRKVQEIYYEASVNGKKDFTAVILALTSVED